MVAVTTVQPNERTCSKPHGPEQTANDFQEQLANQCQGPDYRLGKNHDDRKSLTNLVTYGTALAPEPWPQDENHDYKSNQWLLGLTRAQLNRQ